LQHVVAQPHAPSVAMSAGCCARAGASLPLWQSTLLHHLVGWPREVVESPSLEVLKKHMDMALQDMALQDTV